VVGRQLKKLAKQVSLNNTPETLTEGWMLVFNQLLTSPASSHWEVAKSVTKRLVTDVKLHAQAQLTNDQNTNAN